MLNQGECAILALPKWRDGYGNDVQPIKQIQPKLSLLELTLKTGRTHQIRVHCASMGHPIVGDQVYGSRKWLRDMDRLFLGESSSIAAQLKDAPRQMLHAWQLGLTHPHTGEFMTFESPIPADMEALMEILGRMG